MDGFIQISFDDKTQEQVQAIRAAVVNAVENLDCVVSVAKCRIEII